MVTKKADVVEEDEDVVVNGGKTRLSITLDESQRKVLRIAAALTDRTVGEYATAVIEKAAQEEMKRLSEQLES